MSKRKVESCVSVTLIALLLCVGCAGSHWGCSRAQSKETKEQLQSSKGEEAPNPTPQEIFGQCLLAAEDGDLMAMYTLGAMYEKGEGTQQNKPKAAYWYQKAAEKGHPTAQFSLALMYDLGDGIGKNRQEAAKYYAMAAKNGNSSAVIRLQVLASGKTDTLNSAQVSAEIQEANEKILAIFQELERSAPGLDTALAGITGLVGGGAISYTALWFAGVNGLSAAGLTSGLATLGSIAGGGMATGVGVVVIPVVVLGGGAYIAHDYYKDKKRMAKLSAALNVAISRLYSVQDRLIANAEYYKNEIAILKGQIFMLEARAISQK